jgi:hypothetical protein
VNTLFAGEEITLTASIDSFFRYDGPKINYSAKRFTENELLIVPTGLLAETSISKPRILCSDWNGLTIFFQSNGDIPFDIFSAAFYLLSRYEEYLPHSKDSYGRFAHEQSLAFRENFLDIPLVDLWIKELFRLLQQKFASLIFRGRSFSFIPTYDIDIAFAYNGQRLLKKIASKIKGANVTINGKDAFDVYDWLNTLHERHRLNPVFFFLVSSHRSKYDKNISPSSPHLQRLIKSIAAKCIVGLHPSWQSYHDESEIQKERNRLQRISGKNVIISRQHYIQFTLPYTYRRLLEAGIRHDYSMGYGSINGFRASFAGVFYWYDLMREETTELLLHPFCFMEANSFFEQHFTPQQAASELQHYHDVVKQVQGTLVTVFHNHFLTEEPQWQPWRAMYESFLEKNFTVASPATSLSPLE